ncbi:MAG: CcoQ/FixQ family Cbb3-type cytochrome c oxidase assembly chaperone [Planctomycetes bacterium]|jgi:cbb3-type cytochrome oxidase subunit 3|nr:CcoQ/FixQ family Cbb3-type cytochrome c oxidase assembly chaperone [Planctomycetota bacterium]MBT4028183.1 CcoQ/FixQ family Cbb3-type cytochrome c oxidase assembly chaperone [Planctomycetota bacterium]MBT4559773.1 CcoQ/FixQ family Cbb3-type cytochrome c oxidase assembly chaperone [Planctomycetota bacterium]MBT5101345.1 CcoQ/FixQ family Cbb3-type cytochrome c oxidase assembly chaperone [Planctomycetota bacterium]MBT7011969.1 CcoQ/FixQ family Cbb3-type cytochrome c oxidase assembly chaperone [
MNTLLIHSKEIALGFFMLFFFAVLAWVFLLNPRQRFDADAQLPFQDKEEAR